MQHSNYPSPRTLFIVWLVLMGLSAATMIAGQVTTTLSLGMVWMAVLLLAAGLKSSLILRYYLDLKSASSGWNTLFTGLVMAILVTVFGLYVASVLLVG